MTGVVKPGFSPRKGKENKSLSNNVSSTDSPKKKAKNITKKDSKPPDKEEKSPNEKLVNAADEGETISTSKRSVRPQTKVLRRPTPNLNHPVIQLDSDDSSSSDKSKEENPKRMRVGKNFVALNKRNVSRRKTVPSSKEEGSDIVPSSTSVPDPCHSCNRTKAPERLHSHAKRDARGLMHHRRAEAVKTAPEIKEVDSKISSKDLKTAEISELEKDQQKTQEVPPPELTSACYICKTKVQVSLLLKHESECLENWKKSNNSLSPHLRQLPPRRPTDGITLLDASGDDWCAVQSQLVPCPLCNRTFFPERLPVHSRVCKGGQSPRMLKRASSLKEHSASSSGDGETARPMYLPCNVCGRSFGTWVLPVHEQQCLRRQKKLESSKEKEKNQNVSKEDDLEPTTTDRIKDPISDKLAALGESAWRNHLQQLVPCPRCCRTFFPDRLEVHERSCKGEKRPTSNKIPR